MPVLNVALGERSYPINIQAGLLAQAGEHLTNLGTRAFVISNDTVAPLYFNTLQQSLPNCQLQLITLPDGEQYKTLQSMEQVIGQLLEKGASRDTSLIALGGGVVGDLCGFVAASFQRGVPFVQVPTTLLSQVDSSVGGKTAVNHPLGKNMIGAFYQPQSVLIDPQLLSTLPEREFAAGMAEVIKYGVIYDAAFFDWLEQNLTPLKQLQADALEYAILRCCQIKAEIVAQDEKEAGLRALLNLGHTFGHAIEAEQGYGQWLHGEAVATGIVLACLSAESTNDFSASETRRVQALLQAFDLPVHAPQEMGYAQFMQHMQHDKKVKQGKIRFILPTRIGAAEVTDAVSQHTLEAILGTD